MSVRVITGSAKGRQLKVPDGTRPPTDRMKTSLFDSILDFLPDANVLDLYAGSGAMGIEALSRGGKYAEFVEISGKAVRILKENLATTKLTEKSKVIKMNAISHLEETEKEKFFDIVFFDPPFAKVYKMDFALVGKVLKPGGIAIFRHPQNFTPEETYGKMKKIAQKDFGENIFSVYTI